MKFGKTAIYGVIIIIVLFTTACISTLIFFKWNSKEIVGFVSAMENDAITVTAPHGVMRTVYITSNTHVYKGKVKDATLSIGDVVLIAYTLDSTGAMIAGTIRILDPPSKSRQYFEQKTSEMQ